MTFTVSGKKLKVRIFIFALSRFFFFNLCVGLSLRIIKKKRIHNQRKFLLFSINVTETLDSPLLSS